MQTTLKGPAPVFAAYLLLLAAAYAGGEGGVDVSPAGSADIGPWPVARLASDALGGSGGPTGSGAVMAALLVAFAAAAATWFVLLLAWTGNRVVSFIAGALWCLAPVPCDTFLSADGALLQVLPSLGIGVTLLARERAWGAVHASGGARNWEAAALLVGLLTMASGPSGLAVGAVAVLADHVFHRGHGNSRTRRDALAAALPIASLVWCVGLWVVSPRGTGGFSALEGATPRALAVALVLVAGGGLGIGLRSMGAGPKWIVAYAGFGAAWCVACGAAATFGDAAGGLAGAAGLTLLLPALVWRYLLALIPEPPASQGAFPGFDADGLRSGLPPFPELPEGAPVAVAPAAHGMSLEAAPAVPARSRETPDLSAYPAVPDLPRAVDSSAGPDREWRDRGLDSNIFANYCRPYLSTRTRVLEIGQGHGEYTRLMAPEVEHVVCFDFDRARLDAARQALSDNGNISYVLGDGSGLASLRAGSADLAFSYDLFVHLDQEVAFSYLRDLRRVLRPGGRAILSFANLLDPLGFAAFEAEAAGRGLGGRCDRRVNFLSPDVVRTLVTSAELEVESIHLAANNRDMITILGRPAG